MEDGTGILDSVDAESTRFLAADGRGSFYAAQQAGSQNLCVVTVHAGSRLPMLSCTSADTVEVHLGDVVYVLGPRAQPGEGWEELADRFWRR
ncbi:hypothetical protein K8P10_002809 [Leucobacter sp. Psy1]|uniref:hypothetical protein n=1 Tax=Leucobacter sp. Psy1 TaxID=2875729 RepID=UPI001CD67291|nr:hypothetical protein [Leucobacter sp. Psy1]UBH07298.1 hypothetical protein K8P10_002809 [Leucobacter sp. Psy1]